MPTFRTNQEYTPSLREANTCIEKSNLAHYPIEASIKVANIFLSSINREHGLYRKHSTASQLKMAKGLNISSAFGGGIAFAALLALIYYASVTRAQWKTMQESNRINKISSELAYRPYIGEDGISVAYGEEDARGIWQLNQMQTPKTTMMDFGAQIKNFGPVPGRNHVSEWRIFMGSDEMPSVKIPDTPSTLFPGQVVGLSARVGKKDFQSIISGKTLVVEVTTEYDGPSGHYKECTKSQYVPDNHGFLIWEHVLIDVNFSWGSYPI